MKRDGALALYDHIARSPTGQRMLTVAFYLGVTFGFLVGCVFSGLLVRFVLPHLH